MKVIHSNKLKNFYKTNLYFSSLKSADEYMNQLKTEFLNKKSKQLEYPLSKRKIKINKHSKPKKYLLTQEGNKFLLWSN